MATMDNVYDTLGDEEVEEEEKVDLNAVDDDEDDDFEPLDVVQLDGLALLKIIKHCKETMPEVATGQLLGLNVKGTLEVTNCFPVPPDSNDDAFQLEMMKCLRAVNVDNNTVGWYQSAFLGSFLSKQTLDHQFEYQQAIPSSVLIIYDPFRTTAGNLSIHAYRLTRSFMKLYAAGKFDQESFAMAGVGSSEILEELPIKVHNSHLVHGLLFELRTQESMQCSYDRLNLQSNPFLEKAMEDQATLIDEYSGEQSKYQYYRRQIARTKVAQEQYLTQKRAENEALRNIGKEPIPESDFRKHPLFKPVPKPSRLESFLHAGQIGTDAKEVNNVANQAFAKTFMAEALHKDLSQEQ